ncbi:MAG: hypothetical protein EB059_03805 [Alphaproteobacteria bacterium]|nr:hypothetical protein [Alphaproteobacteria bacterium]
MRITIWVTEHLYSQRIAAALKLGLGDDAVISTTLNYSDATINATDVHIGYGILRGMDKVYQRIADHGKHWFNIDLGYFGAAHFDGTYRIAYKATQNKYAAAIQSEQCPEIAPWKNTGDVALICPPTEHAASFFKVDHAAWLENAHALAKQLNLTPKIRRKDDPENLDDALAKTGAVITYNSSVAWKALQQGIPAFSDLENSTVGSWHGSIQTRDVLKQLSRESLFRFMCANQLTLLDMQQGKLLPMLNRHLPLP